jgi:recombination protein RecA
MAKKKNPNEGSEEQILQAEEGGVSAPKSKKDKEPEKAEEEKAEKPKTKKPTGFDAFMDAAKKKWGTNVARASDIQKEGVQRISFGNIGLDIATFGGCPMGRIIRLWGQQKSAKTGSAFNLVAEWQKHCSVCFKREACDCKNRDKAAALWVDAEGRSADNMPWMAAHGIDMEKLFIMQPATGEQVVDCIDAALRDSESGIGLIVLDSIAHVVSSSELDKATEDGEVIGRNAKLINSALRKWTSALTARGLMAKVKPTLVLLNQIRSKVDMWGGDTMPGGKGLDFATSLDIKFTKKALHYIVNEGTEEKPEWVDKVASGAPGS